MGQELSDCPNIYNSMDGFVSNICETSDGDLKIIAANKLLFKLFDDNIMNLNSLYLSKNNANFATYYNILRKYDTYKFEYTDSFFGGKVITSVEHQPRYTIIGTVRHILKNISGKNKNIYKCPNHNFVLKNISKKDKLKVIIDNESSTRSSTPSSTRSSTQSSTPSSTRRKKQYNRIELYENFDGKLIFSSYIDCNEFVNKRCKIEYLWNCTKTYMVSRISSINLS